MYVSMLKDGLRQTLHHPLAQFFILVPLVLISAVQVLIPLDMGYAIVLGLLRLALLCYAAVLVHASLASDFPGGSAVLRLGKSVLGKTMVIFAPFGFLLGALNLLLQLAGIAGIFLVMLLAELQKLLLIFYISATLDADLTQAALNALSALKRNKRFFFLSWLFLILPTVLHFLVVMFTANPFGWTMVASAVLETLIQALCLYALVVRMHTPAESGTQDEDFRPDALPVEN